MATSMLRLGRLGSLKCLQLERWAFQRSCSAASLCTQAGENTKPTTKTEATSKPVEAPGERAFLLAYKTPVAFPVRFSQPGVFPAQSLVVAEPVANSTATREVVAAAADTVPALFASEPAEAVPHPGPNPDVAQVGPDTPLPVHYVAAAQPFIDNTPDHAVPPSKASSEYDGPAADGSSSSSSSSDSDSDSDSDDEKSEMKTGTKNSTMKEEKDTNDDKVLPDAEHTPAAEAVEGTAPAATVVAAKGAAQAAVEIHSVNSEELADTASEISTAAGDALVVPITSTEFPAEAVEVTAPAATVVATKGAVQADVEAHSVNNEDLVDTAPEISTAAKDTLVVPVTSTEFPAEASVKPAPQVVEDIALPAVSDAQSETPCEVMIKAVGEEKKERSSSDVHVETTEHAFAEAEVATPELLEAEEATVEAATTELLEAEVAPAEAAAENAAEFSASFESTKEPMDPLPVLAEAPGADLQAEAPVEPSQEAAAAFPEPEEPFDNSTYKNYQHHSYNPFTFADLDLEMAKFRLPQPSSGRPSPRH